VTLGGTHPSKADELRGEGPRVTLVELDGDEVVVLIVARFAAAAALTRQDSEAGDGNE
jgi:hypothetical protein